MGKVNNDRPKLLDTDCLIEAIYLKVEVRVPNSDPLLIPPYNRKRYGCKLIDKVEPCGLHTVMIHAQGSIDDYCTAVEVVNEYKNIWNKEKYHDEYEECEAAQDAAYQ